MPARMLEALERRVFRRSKAYGSWSDPDVRVKSTGSRFAKRGCRTIPVTVRASGRRSASSARSDEMSALAAQSRAHGLSPFTEVGSGKALTTGAARSTIGVPLRPFSAPKGDLVLPSAPDIPLRHHGNETIDTGRFADVLKSVGQSVDRRYPRTRRKLRDFVRNNDKLCHLHRVLRLAA
jgi:hypothetical protein